MQEQIISIGYLRANPTHVFVFGDNKLRRGKKGAAILRDEPNAYGFITKKFPSFDSSAYYAPSEYRQVFKNEMEKIIAKILANPDKTFLISKVGSGLADRNGIWRKVIEPGIGELLKYPNVKFLFEYNKKEI